MAELEATPQYRVKDLPNVYQIFGLPMVNCLTVWKSSIKSGKPKGYHTLRTYEGVEAALNASVKYGKPFLCKINKAGKLVLAWTNEENQN